MKNFLSALLLFILGSDSFCQPLWFSNRAVVYISSNSSVYCGGKMVQDTSSSLLNNGKIVLDGELVNHGSYRGKGDIDISGNLTNHALFESDSGQINFSGAKQIISGKSSLLMDAVKLSGSGTKHFWQRTIARRELNLTDRQLDTDTSHFLLLNNDTSALKRSTGFISSSTGGIFFRALKPKEKYLFPLGVPGLYSPAVLFSPAMDTLGMRLAKADATSEGLPRFFVESSICETNSNYYHLLSGDSKGGVQVELIFPPPNLWDAIAGRQVNKDEIWKPIIAAKLEKQGKNLRIGFITIAGLEKAFIAGRIRPTPPEISGKTEVCRQDEAKYSCNNCIGGKISWTATGDIKIEDSQAAAIQWNNTGKNSLSAFITDSAGCSSAASTLFVKVNPNPSANIIINAPDLYFENEIFRFASTTNANIKTWEWTVNNKYAGGDSTFIYAFEKPGEYLVGLHIVNENNCADNKDTLIRILEGIIFPDSFSPDGDGINDEIVFANSGLKGFSLDIFNRWGVPVYSTLNPKLNWNGRDNSGILVNPGCYFYAIKAKIENRDIQKKGTIQVFY